MNRSFKDYAASGVASLDLFSNNRRSISIADDHDFSHDRTASLKLGEISVGSAKSAKSGSEDLLINADDGGKNDYDWLLTPPETPVFPSEEANGFQQSVTAPRTSSTGRSISTTKSSRQPTNHVESNVASRPARSSSVTRSYSSIRSFSNILNTSSASVSSYIRPSSPITRPSSRSRPSTPSRTTPSRPFTPSKARSTPTPALGSRPSTPNSRPNISANSTSPAALSTSRSSTPTRRSTISSSYGRSQTSVSRPSSPSPRIRQQQPVVCSDLPHETPPNLRTSLPDRPVSAGRSRPSPANAMTASQGHGSFSRRASSPVVTRGRSVEPKGRTHGYSNGHSSEAQEPKKSAYVPDSPSRRNVRGSTGTESNGFGRSISKKSLDMAIKHMDIRNGPGNTRPHAGTVLYPQSIRSATSKIHAYPTLSTPASTDSNGRLSAYNNGFTPEKPKYAINGALEKNKKEENGRLFGRVNEVDIFESSRYDAILLKEDLKNTNWLLSSDEKSDQGLLFDHGFESLPEPFGF